MTVAPTQAAVNNFIFEASLFFKFAIQLMKLMILADKIQFLCDPKKPLRYKEMLMQAFPLSKQRHHDAELLFHHGD